MEVRLGWWLTLTQYGKALWELGKFVPAAAFYGIRQGKVAGGAGNSSGN